MRSFGEGGILGSQCLRLANQAVQSKISLIQSNLDELDRRTPSLWQAAVEGQTGTTEQRA